MSKKYEPWELITVTWYHDDREFRFRDSKGVGIMPNGLQFLDEDDRETVLIGGCFSIQQQAEKPESSIVVPSQELIKPRLHVAENN